MTTSTATPPAKSHRIKRRLKRGHRPNAFRFADNPHIKPYIFNDLQGRYGHWPARDATATRTFVVVYGQHASIERLIPIVEALREFGDVYVADNPGFGGMEAAYKVGNYPDLPFYAAHLNHFITEHIPADRQLTLLGISFGFQMITELVANYPAVAARTETAISFVGFVNPGDFDAPPLYTFILLKVLANGSRTRLGAGLFKLVVHEPVIVGIYRATKPIQAKFKTLSGPEAKRYAREQARLWVINDHRTHGATAWDFFKKNDLTMYRSNVPAIHIGVPNDHIFDNTKVAEELKAMYKEITIMELNLPNHAPLDIDTPEQVRAILPPALLPVLSTSRNDGAVTS